MKILHILASDKFSGAENVVCQIISMFSSDGSVDMVYCSPDGAIREALSERGVSFAPVEKLSAKEIKRVIKEEQPDVIHAHDMRATFVASLVCGKRPLISHIHGNFLDLNRISPKSLTYTAAALKAKHIFWVSKSSYDEYVFKSLVKNKSSVLYNVIDTEALYRKMQLDERSYSYDAVYVGRLTEPKNPERLIRVLKLLSERIPDVRVAVVGTGNLEEKTKALASEMKLEENIDFLGFVSNPLKIMHDSKVMIMTSIREGTPMCALEAMALGLPIVNTPTDGMRELVSGGETGYLSDDDAELADRLAEIIGNENLRGNLSAKTRAISMDYNNLGIYKAKISEAYASK